MRLVLYQPEIAANVGAAIRICTCFGALLDIIEPCGFPYKHKDIRRVGMDYGTLSEPVRHDSWLAYAGADHGAARLILLTTTGDTDLGQLDFRADDRIMIGQESAGVPDDVRNVCDVTARIPLAPGARSLNMAVAAAIALADARRQLGYG
ncbi:tRNA (cytidine(34)-2'-O)-methyltransferase [Aquisalinus flavus]|uniref:tRNA (cytidine(34)-2'-O)-methyltransferase n=1 Tax=Aquisalinus flavus TaxID=1526572 RepID=A0A8J2V429_9PROT|nr:TrmH family RNA methyltransferase [Aquisalinus flavus]MBD0427196.1 tRNA (cytidine(34)-2'-O)-methyltransferase [Aquisalinus flavus]UNE47011.1 tRNA (cytidine(34)-2'-O)-methyltransferase [Aquisalinus flavus]GGC99099.1 tRNA (cytidine(34)-2'-O)-methyltransferase [Aquisalinus flavus]